MHLTWNITSDWNVQHMLRDKGNNETWEITWFVRWTICEAGGVGGGGVGWGAGLF